jgi:hypothetical protein
MTARAALAIGLPTLIAIGLIAVAGRAGAQDRQVDLRLLGTYENRPSGIDWLPSGPFAGRLLVSTYWKTGLPHVFETVDRSTGSASQWGTASGWTDEIYFATVRRHRPRGWVRGRIYAAAGHDHPGRIAELAPDGTVLRSDFVTLPGEIRAARGAVAFDRHGVAGGDLIVLSSNHQSDPGGRTTGVWRVNAAGRAVKIAEVATHLEGVTTIPDDKRKYGPWAGKILAGAEDEHAVVAIDACRTRLCAGVKVYKQPGGLDVEPEDVSVIPRRADFYGVDFNHSGGPARIWTAPASEWRKLVGRVLVAQEDGGRLYVIRWTGSRFESRLVSSDRASWWEHVTFAPRRKCCNCCPCPPPGVQVPGPGALGLFGLSLALALGLMIRLRPKKTSLTR